MPGADSLSLPPENCRLATHIDFHFTEENPHRLIRLNFVRGLIIISEGS